MPNTQEVCFLLVIYPTYSFTEVQLTSMCDTSEFVVLSALLVLKDGQEDAVFSGKPKIHSYLDTEQ